MTIPPNDQAHRFARAPKCAAALIALGLFFATSSLAHANTLGTLNIPQPEAATNGDNADAIFGRGDVTANRTIALQPGDTLDDVLARQGIDDAQRAAALKAMSELYDIAQIKAGDAVEISMRASLDGSQETRLVALQLRPAYKGNLAIVAGSDGAFHRLGTAAKRAETVTAGVTTREGTVSAGLMADLIAANVPADVADDVAAAFACDAETPTNPAQGSAFKVVYETAKTGSGPHARIRNVMRYAELASNGENHRVYRYETNNGEVAFMEETGRGVVPFALASPVPMRKARVTSPFGWRVHPVLKVRKFHNGIDFAAPKGTPIYAAEDGVVQTVGWRGNYGRFLKIVHNDRVATTYGHMSGFAKGIHKGSHVKKGQIVAYIGSSGLSTGNHLYFEVLVDNKHVDPAQAEVMLSVNLDGSSLVRFHSFVSRVSETQNLSRP
tara:strand:+ start:1496 stop:2815 length:1320 start_codon:yes stop_codon:yes gene_type:complete